MLASGASKTNRQVALALANVVRDQVYQQSGDAVNKFLGLRERADVLGYLGMPPRVRPERRNEMRVGQKAHIEEQIGVVRHPGLVAKAHDRDQDILVRAAGGELGRDM